MAHPLEGNLPDSPVVQASDYDGARRLQITTRPPGRFSSREGFSTPLGRNMISSSADYGGLSLPRESGSGRPGMRALRFPPERGGQQRHARRPATIYAVFLNFSHGFSHEATPTAGHPTAGTQGPLRPHRQCRKIGLTHSGLLEWRHDPRSSSGFPILNAESLPTVRKSSSNARTGPRDVRSGLLVLERETACRALSCRKGAKTLSSRGYD